jgi:hypothetical protein
VARGATWCPAPEGAPALSAVYADARLRFLAAAFDREIRDVDLWSWTWGSIYVGAGGAQGTATAFVHDPGVRIDLSVGAVSAAVGAASLYVLPLQITLPLRAARRDWNDPDPCRALAQAEATLAMAADKQRVSSGWAPHVGNVVFNGALALILGWGFGRWTSAGMSAGIGVVVGEANVLTQPHRLPGVLDRYRAGNLGGEPAVPSASPPEVDPARGRGTVGSSVTIPF